MINGLWSNSLATLIQGSRPMVILVAVLSAIGVAGVGTAKPSSQRQIPTADTELLTDTPETASESISANIVVPETVFPIANHRVLMMEVTAYCACTKCCGPNAQGITASGKTIAYNNGKFVAADTSVLPFGTKILIPGYDARPVEVIDRGGAIKGNKIDVFFDSHEEALQWGRQKVAVQILE